MLIDFAVENWMSFRDKTKYSMVAGRERQHRERVPRIKKYNMRVLPVSVIYGGNASGKTNFFKALNFAKNLILKGTQPEGMIQVEPFRLDSTYATRPSSFFFTLLIDEQLYEFSFAVTSRAVIEEKLVCISSSSERVLYHRKTDDISFDSSLAKNQFLHFAFQGTRNNQLFLTNSVTQNVKTFKPVYDWFMNKLELVAPDSRFEPFEQFLQEDNPLYARMNEILPLLDTGILHLGGEEIPFDKSPFPDNLKALLQEKVKEGTAANVQRGESDERYMVTRIGEVLVVKELSTYHQKKDGSEVKFEMRNESDGSRRLINLLPAFLEVAAKGSSRVYVIDELNRSMHTLLTRRLLEAYLGDCTSESRSQLLFTTHDVLLMDQNLMRRDEMWVAERDTEGASSLIAFNEYRDIRYDKDIRKSYLQGRIGGVPRILFSGATFRDECSRGDD